MAEGFRYLFTPIDLGPVRIKNRIYSPPHYTMYVDRETGLPTEQALYYYAERARGGVGLLVHSVGDVHPTSEYWPVLPTLHLYDRRVIPLLKEIASRVHEHGAKIFMQIWHPGQGASSISGRPPLAPSPVPNSFATPKVIGEEEIEEMIQAFAEAAGIVQEGGYDGIVLHATHGYLLENFLSPFFNKRNDEYGGTLENRMRFLLKVIDRVRGVIGRELALGMRLVGDELLPGGLTVEDASAIAQKLEETGQIDFLDVDVGSYHNYHIGIGSMYVAPHYNLLAAAPVKAALKRIPLLCAPGRLGHPQEAERILAEGQADMIGIARALIADPEWVRKAREGRAEDIRHCTYSNQYCLGRLFRGLPIGCIQNPAAGREKEWGIGTLTPAPRRKRVMVVGGGPAGLEAARVAALRGHEVALYEKEGELGGQVNLASRLPGREEMGEVTGWLARQVTECGVKVHFRCEVTPELIGQVAPDALVLATGAEFTRTGFSGIVPAPIPGWEGGHVLTPEEILQGEKIPGQSVLIADEEYREVAPGLAELLARQGRKVTIVTSQLFVGKELLSTLSLPHILARLAENSVEILPSRYIERIEGSAVHLFHVHAPHLKTHLTGIDSVILVTAKETRDGLYASAKGKVKEIFAIGDCVAPRDIGAAILEGHRLAREL